MAFQFGQQCVVAGQGVGKRFGALQPVVAKVKHGVICQLDGGFHMFSQRQGLYFSLVRQV